jgi:hypothetical protein
VSVEFDPQRLDRGRRRFEPAVIGVVIVAIGIAAAIAKPWESVQTAPQPAASLAAVTATERASTSAPLATPRSTDAQVDRFAVADAVTGHDAWGVTAVLGRGPGPAGSTPGRPHYSELWLPTSNDASGADTAVVSRDGAEVAALGVTVPDGVQPRAVRVWKLHQSNEFEWINAARIDDQAASHAPLLVRVPPLDGVASMPWEAGQYRVDVLSDDGIHRLSVVIEKQFGDGPVPDVWPVGAPDIVAATASDPSAIRVGLFATVDGAAVSIPARESRPLGEEGAWRDLVRPGDPTVAATYLPRATGLGVMLTSHAAVHTAAIRRLAPEPLPVAATASGGISEAQGRTPYVVFAAPDGGVWVPGVYAVTVAWDDAAGTHRGTWHVALLPGVG